MDLSFPRPVADPDAAVRPGDLAVLMVGVAVRQAASHTAVAQAGCTAGGQQEPRPFAPADGAFNGTVATAMTAWKKE